MSNQETTITERIRGLISKLCDGLHEREEAMTVALLAVLAGQSVFLLGPPGTAKSLMARRLSCAFKDSMHFEYLMQKFSTPEEIFGPINITELKQGNYIRKTEGYLPEAHFAFLDEIWKSNPAILNTLLTIINEKIFRNGNNDPKVPLKALIGASNELPQPGQGLEALWDRFVIRLEVPPLQDKDKFEALLRNISVQSEVVIDNELAITTAEYEAWEKNIEDVMLSPETMLAIHSIKGEMNDSFKKSQKAESDKPDKQTDWTFYVSDRRWQRAVTLLKASAFFSGRTVTNLLDTLLLRHCLWSTSNSRDTVANIVTNAAGSSHVSDTDFGSIDRLLEEAETVSQDEDLIGRMQKAKTSIEGHLHQISEYAKEMEHTLERALITADVTKLREILHTGTRDIEQRKVHIERLLEKPPLPKTYKCPITDMEFIFVKGGTFLMGDQFGDGGVDECPVHEVELDSFYIARYLVTISDWEKICASIGGRLGFLPKAIATRRLSTGVNNDIRPVECVSWNDAQAFIKNLNERIPGGGKYRLPTEAEWEYAARSGGKKEKYAGGDNAHRFCWFKDNAENIPHPVGKKEPNGLGLYDMSGNLWEWCNDWYSDNYYTTSPQKNPMGPQSGDKRSMRGGSYNYGVDTLRTSDRGMNYPDSGHDFGFRLVFSLSENR